MLTPTQDFHGGEANGSVAGLRGPDVAIAQRMGAIYPVAPFHPPERFPEFDGSWLGRGPFDSQNDVYRLVREALFRLVNGYDPVTQRVDVSTLRRLGDIRSVVVKPNWVRQQNGAGECVTTHASVLRPVLDYLLLAFGSDSQITVADIPLQSSDIEQIWRETGVDRLCEYYEAGRLPVRFMDFRKEKAVVGSSGFIERRQSLPGDPLGYVEVCVDGESYLEPVTSSRVSFSVNDYEAGAATCHHRPGRHAYLIPRTVLAADLFVNVPKLKTHCKAGLTACMKNLIGINGEKGWIPHFRMGAPYDGGDEYPEYGSSIMAFKSRVRNALQGRHRLAYNAAHFVWKQSKAVWESQSGSHLTSGGAWPGNDTLWRSILDLVRVITCADESGRLMDSVQRSQLCVIDGIICGEGEGPLRPSPKPVGIIVSSSDPISADWAACHIAGFDWRKIPQLSQAVGLRDLWRHCPAGPDAFTASWAAVDPRTCCIRDLPSVRFRAPSAWAGHIEQQVHQCR